MIAIGLDNGEILILNNENIVSKDCLIHRYSYYSALNRDALTTGPRIFEPVKFGWNVNRADKSAVIKDHQSVILKLLVIWLLLLVELLFTFTTLQLTWNLRKMDLYKTSNQTFFLRIFLVIQGMDWCLKSMFPPGLEPGTFRVLGERDNHYTTETLLTMLIF